MVGLRTEVRGTPPTDEVLIAAKHQSFLDVLMIFGAVPAGKFIMKRVRKVRISKVRLCIPSQVTSSLACTGTLKFLGAPRTGPKTVHFQSICGGGKVNYGNNRTAVWPKYELGLSGLSLSTTGRRFTIKCILLLLRQPDVVQFSFNE